jgi:hypothetical protein
MKRNLTKNKEKAGFALLFSVLISSLLLTIGLSIFSIALKELAISTASRQSIYAFYAADSGREYVLYHDIKIGDIFTYNGEDPWDPEDEILESSILSGEGLDLGGVNFSVDIKKSKVAGEKINTTITATGWDSNGSNKVERSIEESY